MAIKLCTNDLRLYRRHIKDCTRYSHGDGPPTYYLDTAEFKKVDCRCPIWCRGYLWDETWKDSKGRKKPKLNKGTAFFGITDWDQAFAKRNELYQTGKYPATEPAYHASPERQVDPGRVAAVDAVKRFLKDKKDSLTPVEANTFMGYEKFLTTRFIPFCTKHRIVYIDEFEKEITCKEFTYTFKQRLTRKQSDASEDILPGTRALFLKMFKAFLNFCVPDFMARNGAAKLKSERVKKRKFGLSEEEFDRLITAPYTAPNPAYQEEEQTRAAVLLMRWTGMRISDCHAFDSTKIKRNEKGWYVKYIPIKTKKWGTECKVPLPDHVKAALDKLDRDWPDGVNHYFKYIGLQALGEHVKVLFNEAKKIKPFEHYSTPHSLRHTFVIQHIKKKTDIHWIAQAIGHRSIVTTINEYGHWIDEIDDVADDDIRRANDAMLADAAALRR